jgi:hypothetical protein
MDLFFVLNSLYNDQTAKRVEATAGADRRRARRRPGRAGRRAGDVRPGRAGAGRYPDPGWPG